MSGSLRRVRASVRGWFPRRHGAAPQPPTSGEPEALRQAPESAVGIVHERAAAASDAAADEFDGHVRIFEGLYEPLHTACEASDAEACADLLAEWRARAEAERLPAIERALADGASSANELELACQWRDKLADWGLHRDERTEIEITPAERRHYRISGPPRSDALAQVRFPCWTYQEAVIERGVATVEAD